MPTENGTADEQSVDDLLVLWQWVIDYRRQLKALVVLGRLLSADPDTAGTFRRGLGERLPDDLAEARGHADRVEALLSRKCSRSTPPLDVFVAAFGATIFDGPHTLREAAAELRRREASSEDRFPPPDEGELRTAALGWATEYVYRWFKAAEPDLGAPPERAVVYAEHAAHLWADGMRDVDDWSAQLALFAATPQIQQLMASGRSDELAVEESGPEKAACALVAEVSGTSSSTCRNARRRVNKR